MCEICLRRELEKRVLINPHLTEAVEEISKGVPENAAFCISAMKMTDETEHLKVIVTELRKNSAILSKIVEAQDETIKKQILLIAHYKEMLRGYGWAGKV